MVVQENMLLHSLYKLHPCRAGLETLYDALLILKITLHGGGLEDNADGTGSTLLR